MTRAASLILAALISVSAAGTVEGQPAGPSASPAADSPAPADPGGPSRIVQPRVDTSREISPKQRKKMGHAGKKMSKHHGKPGHVGRIGAAPGRNVPTEGQAAQPQ